jgi:F-type H+-transporting ATPase subunit epsilon
MKLRITSLGDIIVDLQQLRSVRGEDATGSFSIWPGHADFLTALETGVISWRESDGRLHYCAVRRGILSVRGGDVAVAAREAIRGDDLHSLQAQVLKRFREREAQDTAARVESTRVEARAMRQLLRYLRPQRGVGEGGGT